MPSWRYQSALRANLVLDAKRFAGGERAPLSLRAYAHVDRTFQRLLIGVSATVPDRCASTVFVERGTQIIPLLPQRLRQNVGRYPRHLGTRCT